MRTVLLLALAFPLFAPAAEIQDPVACLRDPRQSYALYVPSNYTADRRWPILYCLDPMARGRVPVERFAAAAEKSGFLVAGSNNSRNGPWQPIVEAIEALVVDTHARYSIDDSGLYAAGHSGGAQAALNWAQNGRLAGVVACGNTHPAPEFPNAASIRIFAVAGTDDFAFYNMHSLSLALARRGVANRFHEFDGGHDWLPPAAAAEALRFFTGALPAAPAIATKAIAGLAARYEQAASDLFRAEDAERLPLVRRYAREAEKPEASPERRVARQVLAGAYIAYAEDARDRLSKRDYQAAARCWEVNVLIRPASASAWYGLAVAQSASGNKRRALEALEKAAANGFRDAARVEAEPLLAPLRADARYKAALAAISPR